MIDVIIPAYNAETTVKSAVESILNQTVREIRVLVVDDGSTDRTAEILTGMAERDPRLEIITTANRGIVDALNTGLSHCRADIIARHDADDLAYPERFATQLAYLNANPDCIAVGSSVWHIDEAGRKIGMAQYRGNAGGDPKRIPCGDPYLLHPFLMVRRSAMEAAGGYRYVFHAEDSDLYWRLKAVGRLFNLEAILGEYRVHRGSITNRSVLNARVTAVTSQMAALSSVRRTEGRTDIRFDRGLLEELESARSLEKMIAAGSAQLEPAEARFLAVAAAVKMIELRHYRRFRLTREDCGFIARTLVSNRQIMDWETRKRVLHYILHLLRPKLGLRRLAYRIAPSRSVTGSGRTVVPLA